MEFNKEEYYNWLVLNNRKPKFALRVVKKELPYILRLLNNDLSADAVRELMVKLKTAGRKESYINRIVAFIRAYIQFCSETGKPHDAQVLGIKWLKEKRPIRRSLSDDEIDKFLALPKPWATNETAWRIQTLFWSILFYSGMRPGECAWLTRSQIDLSKKLFFISGDSNKLSKSRAVPISPNLVEPLRHHMHYQMGKDQEYLFPTSRKDAKSPVITDEIWNYQWHNRLKRIGIEAKKGEYPPYATRHSFAVRNLKGNNNQLFNISQILGHSKLETTEIYFQFIFEHLISTMENDPLVQKHLNSPRKKELYVEKLRMILKMLGVTDFNLEELGSKVRCEVDFGY